MKLIVILLALLCVSACDEIQPSVSDQPPTGPGISQQSPHAKVETQLSAMGFVPSQNETEKWSRPTDGTTVEVEDNQVTITIPTSNGLVTCTAPSKDFGAKMIEIDQHNKDRTALLNVRDCS